MRLFNFLNEGRSQSIDKEKAISLLKEHCQQAIKKSKRIYRSINKNINDFLFIDPSKGEERISPYAVNNYYNLLFSNLPSWQKYPKRNKSIICTTDYEYANHFSVGSSPYRVFPYDNSSIGVCNSTDIWGSFANYYYSLNDFNRDLKEIFFEYIEDLDVNKSSKDFNTFKENCKKLDKIKNDIDLLILDTTTDGDEFFKKWKESNKTFLDFLNDTFDPSKNGFKLKKIGDVLPKGNELWTDGKCILIKNYIVNTILEEMGY